MNVRTPERPGSLGGHVVVEGSGTRDSGFATRSTSNQGRSERVARPLDREDVVDQDRVAKSERRVGTADALEPDGVS